MIGYEDLVAYGEETGSPLASPVFLTHRLRSGGLSGIRDAAAALEIVDIDGDGKIGLLDFIHFAARLQLLFQVPLPSRPLHSLIISSLVQRNLMKRVLDELLMNAAASNPI
jgi:hypothetical protein